MGSASPNRPAVDVDKDRAERRPKRWRTHGSFNIDDLFALEALRPLGGGFLPWTGYALAPRSLLKVINMAMLHEAQFIVEAGAGLSTVFLARYLRQFGGADAHLVSVDDDAAWIRKVEQHLEREELTGLVTLIYAPQKDWSPREIENSGPSETEWEFELPTTWYETESIHQAIDNRLIDLLLVDGPRGRGTISRYPAVHELLPYLDAHTIAILDDVERDPETEILSRWAEVANLEFTREKHTTIAVGTAARSKQ